MNHCTYIFKNKELKGQICGNRCKNDKCTIHTDKYIQRSRDYVNKRYKLLEPERELINQNREFKKRGVKKGQKPKNLKYHVQYIDVYKCDEPKWEFVGDFGTYGAISEAFIEKYNKNISIDVLKNIAYDRNNKYCKYNIKITKINNSTTKEENIEENSLKEINSI